MFSPSRASPRLARTLLLALAACLATGSAAASQDMAWQDASSLPALVAHLERWLDENSALPRNQRPVNIRTVGPYSEIILRRASHSARHGMTRGLYDPVRGSILLVHPWNRHDPQDVSTLLHELVHHRQAASGHWYCPGAQEYPAYRAQRQWLSENGLRLEVNWIAIVLESGCTPRDIHPD